MAKAVDPEDSKIEWETTEVSKEDEEQGARADESRPPKDQPAGNSKKGARKQSPAAGMGKENKKPENDPPRRPKLEVFYRSEMTKKPVMLLFTREGDGKCKSLEAGMNQKGIAALAKDFHPAKVECSTIDKAILDQYKVKSPPVVIFLDYKGNMLRSLSGKVSINELLGIMKAVLAKNQVLVKKNSPAVADKGKDSK